MAEFGEELSDRELEVLQCLVDGSSNKEIGAQLFISQNTVKVHLRNIYTKLGVSSRTEATTVALQQGLIALPGEELIPAESESDTNEEPEPDAKPAPEADEEPDDTADEEDEDDDEPPTAVSPANTIPAPSSEPPPAQREKPFNWRLTALAIFGILLLFVLGYVGLQAWGTISTPTPSATAVPFVETQIGDSLWWQHRPLEQPKFNMAVASLGLSIYQIGGETADGITNEVSIYDTSNHTWQTGAPKPTAVTSATAAVLFGEIYVPGGRLADGTETAVVEAYSPTNQAWRPVADLPQPIAGGLAISDGSFLYLFGGTSEGDILDTAYVYDAAANSWRPLPPLSQPRTQATGDNLAGQLYVVGGEDGQTPLATCSYFDPSEEQWHDCPDMLLPRTKAGATDLLNKLYVFGGEADESGQAIYSEVYEPNSQTWQVVNTPMLDGQPAWQHAGVTHIENRIYVIGGKRGEQLVDDNLVYTPFVYRTFIPSAVTE